jgi:hypothetical protein
MGFIKGRAYPIILAMAKDGNEQAKKLLADVDSMGQDEVEGMISEILGSKTKTTEDKATLEKTVVPIMPRGGLSKEQQAELDQEKNKSFVAPNQQKFGNYVTPEEEADQPEIDNKPFKYKSMGKQAASITQTSNMTEEQKASYDVDFPEGTEITNNFTGETYTTKKAGSQDKATLEKTVVPIMPRGGLSEAQKKELEEDGFDPFAQAKQAFPSLKKDTVKAKVDNVAKQVNRQDGTYKLENGKPQKVDLNKGFSASFFRPEITDQQAEQIEKIIGNQLGSQYVGVFGGQGELSYNVDQQTADLMANIFNQESVWNNEIQDVVPNPNYDKNKKVDYNQAIKELKKALADKKLKGV